VLTQKGQIQTAPPAHWKPGDDPPRLLGTHLPEARLARQACSRRTWTEEYLGDVRSHGCDLEVVYLAVRNRAGNREKIKLPKKTIEKAARTTNKPSRGRRYLYVSMMVM
jgi:hypothetical protein